MFFVTGTSKLSLDGSPRPARHSAHTGMPWTPGARGRAYHMASRPAPGRRCVMIRLPGYPPQPDTWTCYLCGEVRNWIFRRACQRCGAPRGNGC